MIHLVRDDTTTPKVWATNGIVRRHVGTQGEAEMYDDINDAYHPGVSQPVYPNYPIVDANRLFKLPIAPNL